MLRPRPHTPVASRQEEEESGDDGVDPLANLFTLDGVPCHFFLHHSLTDNRKAKVTKQIEFYGGQTTTRERRAQVILVDEARLTTKLSTMELKYHVHPDPMLRKIYVKPLGFLRQCANEGYFKLNQKILKKGMGGPKPRGGRSRTEFTDQDDANLCEFLAIRTPNPADGGRGGNVVYQQLEELVRIWPAV